MYNYYQPQRSPFLKGRQVSSYEEVKGSPIDFDGTITYFPDLGNEKIYTKQINPDGTSTIKMYNLEPIVEEPKVEYVSKQEFLEAIENLKNSVPAVVAPATDTAGTIKKLNF